MGSPLRPNSDRPTDTPPPAFVSTQVTAARRFYLNLTPGKPADVVIVCGGWEECATDYAIDRATFPYASIEFVARGQGELTLGGSTVPLSPGSVFTYGPGVHHRIRTDPKDRLGKFFVNVVGRRALRLFGEAGLSPGTQRRVAAAGEVRHAFDTLIRLGQLGPKLAPQACALQLELILLLIAGHPEPHGVAEQRAFATFARCREFVDTHFLAVQEAAQVAAACHVDVAYLCRLFQRFHDETPFRYLQRRRMQWAAERLVTTGCLVRQVADELQLDPFQFSRTFKRVHGVAPQTFVQQAR